jgi:hypothetical protein
LFGSPCIGTGRYGRDRGALPYIASSIDNGPALANEFAAISTYPNPFNGSTRIDFTLSKPSRVDIDVFNIIGQLVISLYDGSLESGDHSLTFNPHGNLVSGQYIIRLSADGNISYKKISYLK